MWLETIRGDFIELDEIGFDWIGLGWFVAWALMMATMMTMMVLMMAMLAPSPFSSSFAKNTWSQRGFMNK